MTLNSNLDEKKLRDLLLSDSKMIDVVCEKNVDSNPDWFYQFILRFLANMEMSEEDAKTHYFGILKHKYYLSEKMDRDIGFRVAALDYFLNIIKGFSNPVFLEISFFEELLSLSKEDPKTGCYNMKFFKEVTEKEMKRADRYETNLSIIMIDIDNFKVINDKCGHLFGDKIIKKFTEIIFENLRESDVVGRYGGDEFIVLLPHTGRIGARVMGERLKQRLSEHFSDKTYMGEPIQVTFSAGISTYPLDSKEYDGLVEDADKALYKSKYLGKNRIYDYLEEEYIKNQSGNVGDRRRYQRYELSNKAVELTGQDDLVSFAAKIINISQGGLLLECLCGVSEDMLEKNLKFKIAQYLKKETNDFELVGKIVRVNKENHFFKFQVGVKFDSLIDSPNLQFLLR